MAKEITIDKLTIGNKLTSREVDSSDIFVDGISIKNALKKIPATFVKTVNNIGPDENGNVELNINSDDDYTSFEVHPTNEDIVGKVVWEPKRNIAWYQTASEYSPTKKYCNSTGAKETTGIEHFCKIGTQLYVCIVKSLNEKPSEYSESWKKIEEYPLWDNTKNYSNLDVVTYNDEKYIVTNSGSKAGVLPTNTSFWTKIDQSKIIDWDFSKEYSYGYFDGATGIYGLVKCEGQEYICVKSISGLSPTQGAIYSEELDADVFSTIPAQMTCKFIIRTNYEKDDIDVVVDWGDGTKIDIKNDEPKPIEEGSSTMDIVYTPDGTLEYKVTVSHKYVESEAYDVKVLGHKYWGLTRVSGYNLISKIFDENHNLASNVSNISNLCNGALRLTKILVPPYRCDMFANVHNFSGLFQECSNLRSAKGLESMFAHKIKTANQVFKDCYNLLETDVILPNEWYGMNPWNNFFYNCKSLISDFYKMIPTTGIPRMFNVSSKLQTLNECNSMTMTNVSIVGKYLWDNPYLVFANTGSFFSTFADDIREQIPTTWGGTKQVQ